MDNLNRRAALKILGGIPLATSIAGIVSCKEQSAKSIRPDAISKAASDSIPRLNIILHGMFALNFDFQHNTLSVLPPKLYGHAYGFGDWKNEILLDDEDAAYTLQNATARTPMNENALRQLPGALLTWSASHITGVQPKGSPLSPFCTLNLGIPDAIWPLRPLNRTVSDPTFFTGATASGNHLDSVPQLPLIYVLTYTNVKSNNPPILGDWTGTANAPFWNLHVHAAPAFTPAGGHLTHGLMKLCQLFTASTPLDLQFNPRNTTILLPVNTDADTGHETVPAEQEEGLDEIRAGILVSGKKTSRVHTCMSLMTINT